MNSYNQEFKIRLYELRKEKGITQAQLANAIGVFRNSIYNYESGRRTPDADTIIKLVEFFNVSSDYLLGLTSVKTNDTLILKDYEKIINALKSINKLTKDALSEANPNIDTR